MFDVDILLLLLLLEVVMNNINANIDNVNVDSVKQQGQRCKFLILACSAKNQNYCIAGLKLDDLGDGSKYSLVRLVTDDQQTDGAVPSELLTIEGKQTQIGDIVEYYVKQYPLPHQPENYLICSDLISIKSTRELRDSTSPEDHEEYDKLGNLFRKKVKELCDSDDDDSVIFYDTDRTILPQLLQLIGPVKNSIELRVVEKIRVYKTINSAGHYKVRADFTYKGKEYSSISVTDPHFFDMDINQIKEGTNCLVLFSFANQEFFGAYYKLVASILGEFSWLKSDSSVSEDVSEE